MSRRNRTDVIAAIATASGRGGIGVVRVSGPAAGVDAVIAGVVGRALPARRAVYADFRDAQGGVLDSGLALYFAPPHTYTGEPVLELQGHGGPVVLRLVLARCLDLGARPAEPGEFTYRAYLNGRLDLAQAESVADMINAQTAYAARSAQRSLSGEFSHKIQELVSELIGIRAELESGLDFPEENLDLGGGFQERIRSLLGRVEAITAASRMGSLLREGSQVVLAGPPNVGKSSLLNRLSGEEAAIVTDIPGTTRDSISRTLDLDGLPVHIVDTAGLRETQDVVEQIGVARTQAAMRTADAVLWISDITEPAHDTAAHPGSQGMPTAPVTLNIFNKIDLQGQTPRVTDDGGQTTVWISARTGAGLDLLRQVLKTKLGWEGQSGGEGIFLARTRHLEALVEGRQHLMAALAQDAPELMAEELRLTQHALSSITGEFSADDLLGEIFSRFCIGK